MAQRTVHYAMGMLLAEQCGIGDRSRFLLGSILPDAFADPAERDATHFKAWTAEGKRYFDFTAFRARFSDQMAGDGLYLGYYMHLVEDCYYRRFLYPQVKPQLLEGGVAALHNDYHLLNAYIVEKYRLRNIVTKPADFAGEAIFALANFALDGFLAEFAQDFSERPEGRTRFLTEAMLDDFIARYTDPCARELRRVLDGESCLQAADFAWS